LFIADETGIARTGRLLLVVTAVLVCENKPRGKTRYSYFKEEAFILYQANDAIMNVIKPGQHGSTFEEPCCGCA
jgi:ornithine--oxo-acid transaminase